MRLTGPPKPRRRCPPPTAGPGLGGRRREQLLRGLRPACAPRAAAPGGREAVPSQLLQVGPVWGGPWHRRCWGGRGTPEQRLVEPTGPESSRERRLRVTAVSGPRDASWARVLPPQVQAVLQHAAPGRLQARSGARRLHLLQPPPHSCPCEPHVAGPGPQTARGRPHGLPAPQRPTDGPGGPWAERRTARGRACSPGAQGGQRHGQRVRARCSCPSGRPLFPRPLGEPGRVQALSGPCGWQSQNTGGQQLPGRVVIGPTGRGSSQPPSCCDPSCPGPSPGHAARPGSFPSVSPPGRGQCRPSICESSGSPGLDPVGLQDAAGP